VGSTRASLRSTVRSANGPRLASDYVVAAKNPFTSSPGLLNFRQIRSL